MKRLARFTLIIVITIAVTLTASPINARVGILGRIRGVMSAAFSPVGRILDRSSSRQGRRQGRRQNRQSSRQSVMARHAMGGHDTHDMHAAVMESNHKANTKWLAPIPQLSFYVSRFSTIDSVAFSTIVTYRDEPDLVIETPQFDRGM